MSLSNHMTIGSITFCIIYGVLATVMMICGYNIMTTLLEKIKRQDEDSDK